MLLGRGVSVKSRFLTMCLQFSSVFLISFFTYSWSMGDCAHGILCMAYISHATVCYMWYKTKWHALLMCHICGKHGSSFDMYMKMSVTPALSDRY